MSSSKSASDGVLPRQHACGTVKQVSQLGKMNFFVLGSISLSPPVPEAPASDGCRHAGLCQSQARAMPSIAHPLRIAPSRLLPCTMLIPVGLHQSNCFDSKASKLPHTRWPQSHDRPGGMPSVAAVPASWV